VPPHRPARPRPFRAPGATEPPARRRRPRLTLVLVALALVAGVAASGCTAPPPYTTSTVLTNLNRPWDLAFLPDGDFLFTERVGRISIYDGGTVRLLATPADVVAVGEGGMMGLAVDPAFATNRRLYTCFLSNVSGALDVRLVRWRLSNDATTLTERTDIVTGIPANPTGRHSGCRPRFGPDGQLWVGTGDAATNTVAQDARSLGGKVLRVTTSGAGAPGNPGGTLDPRIYTYGHRNVQGVAFARNGQAYSVEHGTDRDDEVNLLVSGANYGWDPVPPGGGTLYDETQPMTDLIKFPNAKPAVWSSGFPTIAPSGATFLDGDRWGNWNGRLAMAVLKGNELRVLAFTADGTGVGHQWTSLTDRGRLRVAVQAPNGGALYVLTDSATGSIFRLDAPAGSPAS
jgi:glucose/arabinose dehydrogenase